MRGHLHEQAGVMRRLAVFRLPFLLSLLFNTCAFLSHTSAEVRVVTAQGQHRMGDRDTREDAVRLATESAKRNALEQVATYLESITVTDGMDLVRDEVRTYSAGLVLVLDQQIQTLLDGDTVVVNVDLVTQIDTEDMSRAIAALRESEDARVQLSSLRQDNEQLQKDLAAANQALANASTPDQAQQAALQRHEILNRVQSNAMVSQVWTDWVLMSPVAYSSWIGLGVGLAQTRALLNSAGTLYPGSPHVTVAEQVIATRQPPPPPQPPAPPAPGSPHRMPRHEIVAPPGSPGKPRTLNEITHTSLTRPPQASHQPGSRLTDIHRVNPSLPPNEGQIQFRQHNGGMPPRSAVRPAPGSGAHENLGGQPSITRRLPPTTNRVHPPAPEVPRVPYQVVPRTSGGGQGGGSGRREDHGGQGR